MRILHGLSWQTTFTTRLEDDNPPAYLLAGHDTSQTLAMSAAQTSTVSRVTRLGTSGTAARPRPTKENPDNQPGRCTVPPPLCNRLNITTCIYSAVQHSYLLHQTPRMTPAFTSCCIQRFDTFDVLRVNAAVSIKMASLIYSSLSRCSIFSYLRPSKLPRVAQNTQVYIDKPPRDSRHVRSRSEQRKQSC